MKLFYTNATAKAEIAALETRISEFETSSATASTEVTRLTAELQTATEATATLTTERDEAIAAFSEAEKATEKATAELTAANANLSTLPAAIEQGARAKFESLGGPPIAAADSPAETAAAAKTMAEFRALSPYARMTFIKGGGKLTD